MPSRRQFMKSTLRNSALISLAPIVPGFLAKTVQAAQANKDKRILVVLFLDGGNDGINTVVPYRDEGYVKYRKSLRLPTSRLIKIDDSVGFHPALRGFGKLLESSRLAIVQGVSYPNPNLSHFRSSAIWNTARLKEAEKQSHGWIGTALDKIRNTNNNEAQSVYIGSGKVPIAMRGRRSIALAMQNPNELLLDPNSSKVSLPIAELKDDLSGFVNSTFTNAYASAQRMAELVGSKGNGFRYPATAFAGRLRTVARLIKAGFGASVYYAKQSGYDTHSVQLLAHQNLLRELGDALAAFLDDLTASKLDSRVCVMVFSEFGRRVKENGSKGTDHGTSGPVFIAGSSVRSGLHGQTPSLTDLDSGNLKWSVDFRRVYSTLLQSWLSLPSETALPGKFEKLPLFAEKAK